MIVAPIRRGPSLTSQVYEAIRASIVTGEHEPGGRVVVEHLAARLGVSPTPVREALARLLQEGLVTETAPGRLRVVALTPQYVTDTFLVRSALEGLAAELAAPNFTDAHVVSLRDALARTGVALAANDLSALRPTEVLLHRTVCETARNDMLTRELGALQCHVDYIRGYSQRHVGDHLRLSHEEHLRLLDALAGRDPLAAREAMERHIRNTSARIVRLIDFRAAPRAVPT